jgi:cytochrome c-type biogenesis protein CcmH
MGLWLALGMMTLLAVGLAVAPLVRRARPVASRRDYDLRVYRAQLAELAREQERGVVGEREADAARLEVERRILAADAAHRRPRQGPGWRGRHWVTAAVLSIGLPALAGGLYWRLGSPDQPAAPFAGRAAERAPMAAGDGRQQGLPAVETMIARLEARQKSDPDDLETFLRLGQAYALAGQFERSAATYREASARHPEVAELQSALGEALVMASGGIVGEEARAAFAKALEHDPGDPRARFYDGLAKLQRGERQLALDAWVSLIKDAPADAPWLADLRRQTAALAEDLGLDPAQALPASRPASAAEADTDGAGARAAATRLEAQLAANPKDYQGWIRLAQAWAQLGEAARAKDALARGAQAYPGAPFVQQQFQAAAAELGLEPGDSAAGARGPSAEQKRALEAMSPAQRQETIRGMVEGLAARLEQQPDDVEGWRMLGRSWAVLGDAAKSAEAYSQVASRRPDDLAAQLDYAEALLAKQSVDQPPSPEVVAQLQQVLKLDGDNPVALFHLGRAAAARGDTGAATRHWQHLLAQLPADAPVRPQLQRLIEELQTGG